MSLYQGLLGAQVELAGISNPVHKLRRIASISKLFASELVSTVALAPFAVRALRLHKSLPHLDSYSPQDQQPVYVVRDVRYAEAPRALVDLYLPTEAAAAATAGNFEQQQQLAGHAGIGSSSGRGVPVVVFVHGGVWAAGDKWHYAPMAHYLARLGVMACVVQYTLYPEGLVPQLVEEVSAAFDWAMDHVGQYGGDTQQVSLVGHSAGAQLCMMALLQRAQQAHNLSQQQQQQAGTPPLQLQQQQQQQQAGTPPLQQQQQQPSPHFPRQFVAITGVYDIAKHYSYEKDRGVHELSTMKRAMGGFEGFAAMSPAVILGAALQQQQQGEASLLQQQQQEGEVSLLKQQQQQQQQEPPPCGFYSSFHLAGESIAHRIGFERGSAHHFASEAALQLQSIAGMAPLPLFDLAAAAYLPPTVLLSSCTDLTVPWFESAEMYYRLLDCGVPVKHLVYNKVGHGDFVVDWPTRLNTTSSDEWGSSSSSSSSATVLQKQSREDPDDWGSSSDSRDSSTNSSSSGSGSAPEQQRQLLLEQLPHYLRDIAVVAMGQQQVNFVQRAPLHRRRAVQLKDGAAAAAAVGWQPEQQQRQQESSSKLQVVAAEAAELN